VLKKNKKGCNGKDFNVYMFCKLGIGAARLGLLPALRVTHAAVFICVRRGVGDFEVFRPAGATRCIDRGDIWRGGVDRKPTACSAMQGWETGQKS